MLSARNVWGIICDASIPLRVAAFDALARIVFLLGTPLAIYLACYAAHISLLTKWGNGAQRLPPQFQASLEGRPFPDTHVHIAYGSTVRLRFDAEEGIF